MNKTKHIKGNALFAIVGLIVAGILAVGIIGGVYFSYSNSEIRLRNAIAQKQRDNQSELDNLQKKIAQAGQVTKAQWDAIKDIVVGNSQARTAGGAGSLATLVREAVPSTSQIDSRQFLTIITSSRDAFTMRQKEILDMKREHDNILTTFPGSLICGGRPPIEVVIVTSDRAEENFRTGKDNDIDAFGSPR
jgi:hypothetical protein